MHPFKHMEISRTLQCWQLEIKHNKSQTKLKTIIFYLNAFKGAWILCFPFWWFSGHIFKWRIYLWIFFLHLCKRSFIDLKNEGCLTLFWLTGVNFWMTVTFPLTMESKVYQVLNSPKLVRYNCLEVLKTDKFHLSLRQTHLVVKTVLNG